MKGSFKNKLKALTASAVMLTASILPAFNPIQASAELTERDNFARLLQHSMYFYDANMCGTGVDENSRLSWRGDCHAYDAKVPLQPMNEKSVGTNLSADFIKANKDVLDPDGDGCVDVSGGFHDAGDHVEFGMPENYSAAALGWGYYEFRDAYKATGQDDHIETILRYFNDYLMKCTFRDKNGNVVAHCYQVGDGDIDHALWQSPEVDSMARPAFFLTDEKPQVDYCVSAAASLTINYLNFKDTDPEYAEKSLDYAKALYDFAWKHISKYDVGEGDKFLRSDNADGPKQYYLSSKWEDDFVWSAAWLYIATEDVEYLNNCLPYVDYYAPPGWAFCWNDVWSGANTLLGVIDLQHPELDLQNMYRKAKGKNQYDDADFWLQIEKAIDTWQTKYSTKQGYAFMSTWGSARYDTAMQLVTLVYDKYKNNDKPGSGSAWAKRQMEYLMGDNDITYLEPNEEGSGSRCFIVGFNENSCKYPHHRAASGLVKCEDPSPQRHVLYGALVGGPDGKDAHMDITKDYIYNEVTIDYNAAFVGAAAGLYHFYGSPDDPIDENFPPEETNIDDDETGGGNGYWVEAFAVNDINADGAGVTKISFMVRTNSSKPSDKVSIRYYFNSSEISNVASLDGTGTRELYDQSSAEAADDGADGILSGPFKYDKKENTYYMEVSWDGYKIANSGKKYQFSMGMYYGDKWDPENDYSYQDLPVLKDTNMFADNNEVKTDYICVYDDGVLVGGIEPDGSTPVQAEKSTEKPTEKATEKATEKPTEKATEKVTEKPTEKTTEKPSATEPTERAATEAAQSTTSSNSSKTSSDRVSTLGDVNEDGTIDILDVITLNKNLLGKEVLTTSQQKNADVNKSGLPDATDSMTILKYIVGLVKGF